MLFKMFIASTVGCWETYLSMTTTRAFRLDDLFKFNNINLDVLTETYNTSFYYTYVATWPEFFKIQEVSTVHCGELLCSMPSPPHAFQNMC